MEQTIGALIHNRFDFEVTDAITGEVKQKASAYNMILDTMWTALCNLTSFFDYIDLGSGTGTLSATRTSLFNLFCDRYATAVTQVYAYPVSYCKKSIQLTASEYVGKTITEVGVKSSSKGLVTHALLQDSEGNPISILKTATDIITIYATIFATVNTSTDMDLIGLPGSNELLRYLGSGGASGIASSSVYVNVGESDAPSVPSMTSPASLSIGSVSLTANTTKDIANKKITSNVGRIDVGSGNGNIKEVVFGSMGRMVLPNSICPAKTYTGVSLGTGDGANKDFVIPSKNLQADSIVVYKDSVAQVLNTDYTLEQVKKINFMASVPCTKAAPTSLAEGAVANSLGWFFKCDTSLVYGTCVNGVVTVVNTSSAVSGNSHATIAMSPTELLLAVPNGKNITFYTVVDNKIVTSDVTLDVLPTYNINKVAFSADGQHLAVAALNRPLRVYKKDGNAFKLLTTGVPTTASCYSSENYGSYSTLTYFGDLLVFGMYSLTLVVLKRDGDTYTACTVDAASNEEYDGICCNADASYMYSARGNSYLTCYSLDASKNLTKQANITVPGGYSLYSLKLLSDNLYLSSSSSGLYLFKIVGSIMTLVQAYTETRGTSYRPLVDGQNTFLQLSDTMCAAVYGAGYSFQPFEIAPRTTVVHETTAPASAAAITADYTVNGIHKTTNYVLDFQISIQFGEGV